MKYKYSKSWKQLLISCSIASAIFFVLHLIMAICSDNILHNRAIGVAHIWWIPAVIWYVNDYRHLVLTHQMPKSAGRFIVGMAPILGCEIANIFVLVYTILY